MPLSNNISLYEDVRPHLDQALAAPRGIRITVHSRGAAVHLRQRLYQLRKLDRIASCDIYEVGDQRRGTSVWDDLIVEVEDNTVIIRHGAEMQVEEL